MKAKRLISGLLVLAMTFLLAACGKEFTTTTENGGYIMKSMIGDTVELGTPDRALDLNEVYSKVTYTPEMFYGKYTVEGMEGSSLKKRAVKKHIKNTELINSPVNGSKITSLPYSIVAGYENMGTRVDDSKNQNWIKMRFLTAEGSKTDCYFTYEVAGNKLILTAAKNYNYNIQTEKATYELTDSVMEYEFAFSGRYLTLSYNGESVKLKTACDSKGKDAFYAYGYLNKSSARIDDIDYIRCRWIESAGTCSFTVKESEGNYINRAIAVLTDDGLLTMTVPYETGTVTYQFVYFYCGRDGIILTDGDNTYYYNASYNQKLSDNISSDQASKLSELSDEKAEEIVEKRDALFDDLAAAFAAEGITAQVNKTTGEVALDTAVLFGGDSAVVTDEGKAFLNKFLKVYTNIIYNEKYNGFIAKTMIEGHIAPIAGTTYEKGMPLSEESEER